MRQISTQLVKHIEYKVQVRGYLDVFNQAVAQQNPDLLFETICKATVGAREEGGNNMGFIVGLYQDVVGGIDGEAWCMAYMQAMVAYVEYKLGIKSRLYPSEHCLTVMRKTPADMISHEYFDGAILIWQHGNSEQGHTGRSLKRSTNGNSFFAIEGNTVTGVDKNGNLIRDGGGVYLTTRKMTGDGDMKLIAFIKPF